MIHQFNITVIITANFENIRKYYIISLGDENMMRNAISLVDLGNQYSLERCHEVTDFSNPDHYRLIFDEMKEICLKENAYGCAATHFGLSERFILIIEPKKDKNSDKIKSYDVVPYFNPKITFMCGSQIGFEATMGIENCIGEVIRPYYIELEAQDINGNTFKRTAQGFDAVLFDHEIDLLDGVRFTDRATNILYNVNAEKRIEIKRSHPPRLLDFTGIHVPYNSKQKSLIYKKARQVKDEKLVEEN